MKLDDCSVGDTVQSKFELSETIKEGTKLEIEIIGPTLIKFKNHKSYWSPEHFEKE